MFRVTVSGVLGTSPPRDLTRTLDEIAAALEPLIPCLRRYAWALVRNNEAADDLVQDSLERAIARWHLHRDDRDARAWLYTILRNLYLDDTRRRRRRGPHFWYREAEHVVVHEARQERRMIACDALAALAAMPEEQRSLLLLVGVEDLSYREAARVLDVPVGTIMSRLSRAREKLRRMIDTGAAPALRRVK